jgi:hypothetical protein
MASNFPGIFGLCGALLLLACSDDATGDDDVGESSSESTSESESGESTEDSTGSGDDESDTASTDGESDTESDGSESDSNDADPTDSDSTETDAETDATETDETTETGGADFSCADDNYVGVALAEDGWGIGDFCDEIWVCADEDQVEQILAAVPNSVCTPGEGCPDMHCTISYQTMVDGEVYDNLCDALLLEGIDDAYCIVLGP